MIEGQDIFRKLIIDSFISSTPTTRQEQFYSCCSLCGDQDTGICSGCLCLLSDMSRLQRKAVYSALKEVGDKERAAKLEKLFTIHKSDKPKKAKIRKPTKDREGNLEYVDLKGTRKKHGLTQTELAEKLGVDRRVISEAETGRSPLPERCVLPLKKLINAHA